RPAQEVHQGLDGSGDRAVRGERADRSAPPGSPAHRQGPARRDRQGGAAVEDDEGAGGSDPELGLRPRGPGVAEGYRALSRSGRGVVVAQPAVRAQEPSQPGVVGGQWREPGPETLARPPGTARVARRREAVAVERRPDKARWRAREGIAREER